MSLLYKKKLINKYNIAFKLYRSSSSFSSGCNCTFMFLMKGVLIQILRWTQYNEVRDSILRCQVPNRTSSPSRLCKLFCLKISL